MQQVLTYASRLLQTLMANAIDQKVAGVAGKAALAMEGFARALRKMPATIADNGGLDSAELVTQLRAAHHAVCDLV